ncbi:MAG TPA: glycerophosphodiester phosphodiesterase [Homoserinimonas sp.]|nr:glycerophosphodiester phosphodiesterase [Homoserinimonas sp.]
MRSRPRRRRGADDDSFFSPTPPRVLAHRGLAIEAPENTMLAFLKALSAGAEYIETDVHASQDGIAVIAHDESLSRVAGRSVRVDHLTMAELRRVNLGDGQAFASLAEVLDAFPSARFNIDIKSDDAIEPTVAAILAAGALKRVLIASFSDRRRKAAVKRLPGVATSASKRASAQAVAAARLGLGPLVKAALRGVDAVQLPAKINKVRIITPRLVSSMHAAGVEVHAWTINDVPTMERLLAMGVDGLVTDRADLALEVRQRL